jgi:hypothetical protein
VIEGVDCALVRPELQGISRGRKILHFVQDRPGNLIFFRL